MKHLRSLIVISLVVFAVGCAPTLKVTTDFDPGANFGDYKTFNWKEVTIPGDALADNSILQNVVKSAIKEEMTKKGFKLQESGETDLVVVFHGRRQYSAAITNWHAYGWYSPWWGPYGGYTSVSTYQEGTLVIDIVDVKKKQLVWRGLGTKSLKGYSDSEKRNRMIKNAITRIFMEFPPH